MYCSTFPYPLLFQQSKDKRNLPKPDACGMSNIVPFFLSFGTFNGTTQNDGVFGFRHLTPSISLSEDFLCVGVDDYRYLEIHSVYQINTLEIPITAKQKNGYLHFKILSTSCTHEHVLPIKNAGFGETHPLARLAWNQEVALKHQAKQKECVSFLMGKLLGHYFLRPTITVDN